MTETEWLACGDPNAMLEFLRGKPNERRLRLFACACVRHTPLGDGRTVWDLLTDKRSRDAVEMAERHADGLASREEMGAAQEVAHGLADDVGDVALYAAASPGRTDVAFGYFSIRNAVVTVLNRGASAKRYANTDAAKRQICDFFRDIYGPLPFRSLAFDFGWACSTATSLAEGIHRERTFDRMPILADALEDAGCTDAEILNHCRQPGEHVRGCWVVDLIMGKS